MNSGKMGYRITSDNNLTYNIVRARDMTILVVIVVVVAYLRHTIASKTKTLKSRLASTN